MADPRRQVEVEGTIAYGNVADVELSNEGGSPVIAFAADAKGGPERGWFCFRVVQPRRTRRFSKPFTLVLKHLETMLGGGEPSAIQPVVRYAAEEWRRLPPGKPAPTDDGRMGAWWTLEPPVSFVDVALCYPYGQAEAAAFAQESGGYRVDTIGVSEGGRPMIRLANDYGTPRDGAGEAGAGARGRRPGVYLLARQHAGETPGSWVLEGVLRRLAEAEAGAGAAGAGPIVWAVPFVDVDGVEAGRYGKDHPPHDFNRAWGRPPMRHEAMVMQRDAERWAARCAPALMLDFHAPGIGETEGVYAYRTADGEDKGWGALIGEHVGAFAADRFVRCADYPSRYDSGRATRWFEERIGCPTLAIETPYARCGERVMSRDDYREVGRGIGEAALTRLG